MMTLDRLLAAASLPPSPDAGGTPVLRLTCRSAEAGRGDVFVAYRGHRLNGHDFCAEAYRHGARLFLCEQPVPLPADATVILSENTRKSAAEMMSCLYGAPERRLRITGITGTKGKTTAAFALCHMLRAFGHSAATVGTVGACFGGATQPTRNTTPDLFFLYPYMHRLVSDGCEHLILEVSSQALADRRIDPLPIEVAAFTSFGRDHIGAGEHASEDEYLAAKRRLFTELSPRYTVINADDPVAASMPCGRDGGVGCSLCGRAELSAEVTGLSVGGTAYRYEGRPLTLPLLGRHFVTDALIAAACAHALTGEPIGELLASLSTLHVPGRSEYLLRAGRHILIDYAHNAMSLHAVTEACRSVFSGRLIGVFGAVDGRGEARHAALAEAADALLDLTVLTSDTAGRERTLCLCEHMRRHFAHPYRVRIEPSRERAIRLAYSLSRAGDVLLLLGKGEEGHAECPALTDRAVAQSLGAEDF